MAVAATHGWEIIIWLGSVAVIWRRRQKRWRSHEHHDDDGDGDDGMARQRVVTVLKMMMITIMAIGRVITRSSSPLRMNGSSNSNTGRCYCRVFSFVRVP